MSNTVKWILAAVVGIILICSCLCLGLIGIYNLMLNSMEETTEVSIYWGYTTNPPDILRAMAPGNAVWLTDLESAKEYAAQYEQNELAYSCLNPEDEQVSSITFEEFAQVPFCEQGNVYVFK